MFTELVLVSSAMICGHLFRGRGRPISHTMEQAQRRPQEHATKYLGGVPWLPLVAPAGASVVVAGTAAASAPGDN